MIDEMTVKEWIEKLGQYNQEDRVIFYLTAYSEQSQKLQYIGPGFSGSGNLLIHIGPQK